MSLIQNERTKLFATALNNLGVAIIITGLIAPTVAAVYGTMPAHSGHWVLIGVSWLFTGASLHVLAQLALGRLRA